MSGVGFSIAHVLTLCTKHGTIELGLTLLSTVLIVIFFSSPWVSSLRCIE